MESMPTNTPCYAQGSICFYFQHFSRLLCYTVKYPNPCRTKLSKNKRWKPTMEEAVRAVAALGELEKATYQAQPELARALGFALDSPNHEVRLSAPRTAVLFLCDFSHLFPSYLVSTIRSPMVDAVARAVTAFVYFSFSGPHISCSTILLRTKDKLFPVKN